LINCLGDDRSNPLVRRDGIALITLGKEVVDVVGRGLMNKEALRKAFAFPSKLVCRTLVDLSGRLSNLSERLAGLIE
jgi:hypothetical protein